MKRSREARPPRLLASPRFRLIGSRRAGPETRPSARVAGAACRPRSPGSRTGRNPATALPSSVPRPESRSRLPSLPGSLDPRRRPRRASDARPGSRDREPSARGGDEPVLDARRRNAGARSGLRGLEVTRHLSAEVREVRRKESGERGQVEPLERGLGLEAAAGGYDGLRRESAVGCGELCLDRLAERRVRVHVGQGAAPERHASNAQIHLR